MPRRKPVPPSQLDLPLDTTSLRTARERILVERETDGGVICNCCSLLVKVHPRQVTSTMARVQIALARHHDEHGDEWVDMTPFLERPDVPKSARRGGDWSKLKYWGLLEAHPEKDLWRITEDGYEFAHDRHKIQKVLKIFNDEVIGVLDPTLVSIRECLGKRFRLEDLYEGLSRQLTISTPQHVEPSSHDPELDALMEGW